MLLSGHTSTVCQIDGRWRYPVPQCLAPCVVPTISQGVVSPIDTDVDLNATTTLATVGLGSIAKVKHGTILEVFCDDHYEFPISSLAPPTCNNGTWSVIPRCVPARCKIMPKPPKNGMVLAPKTEHGMKARFKCKDGFVLTGIGGKNITDPNEYVLSCSFGNWTGETPLCIEVYCSFPGYIPNGKVLLVGNMGLYDYRPYVKKVVNNKQIMYECDKGYIFADGAPPGATCVGGKWSPLELPICLPGQHPRLRWNRKRRSIDQTVQRFNRAQNFIQQLRFLKRWKRDLSSKPIPLNVQRSPSNLYPIIRIKRDSQLRTNLYHLTRKRRDSSDLERAYTKYYDKIKEKYKSYVKNLLAQNRLQVTSQPNSMIKPHTPITNDGKVWYHPYNNPENNYHHQKMSHLPTNEFMDDADIAHYRNHHHFSNDKYAQNAYPNLLKVAPIAIPNINEQLTSINSENENNLYDFHDTRFVNNEYNLMHQEKDSGYLENTSHFEKRPNETSIIAQLKQQIVRKKRSPQHDEYEDDRKGRRGEFDDDGGDFTDSNGKKKPKIPCEVIFKELP